MQHFLQVTRELRGLSPLFIGHRLWLVFAFVCLTVGSAHAIFAAVANGLATTVQVLLVMALLLASGRWLLVVLPRQDTADKFGSSVPESATRQKRNFDSLQGGGGAVSTSVSPSVPSADSQSSTVPSTDTANEEQQAGTPNSQTNGLIHVVPANLSKLHMEPGSKETGLRVALLHCSSAKWLTVLWYKPEDTARLFPANDLYASTTADDPFSLGSAASVYRLLYTPETQVVAFCSEENGNYFGFNLWGNTKVESSSPQWFDMVSREGTRFALRNSKTSQWVRTVTDSNGIWFRAGQSGEATEFVMCTSSLA